MGKQWKQCQILFLGAPESLQMVIAAMKLEDAYSLEGKTITLTRRTFVGKVMSLLLNMLSRLVITFLPRSQRLLISWLQPPSAVILEPPKIKSDTVSTALHNTAKKKKDSKPK